MSLNDICPNDLHSNTLICRPRQPKAEKPGKHINKQTPRRNFVHPFCRTPVQNYVPPMTDCTAYHDVFRTIPVLEYILKMGRELRLLLLACDINMSTVRDTPMRHKIIELYVVTATM
jgi:hypothetical protein